jgi:hypothetical protein
MSQWAVTYLDPNDRSNLAAGYTTVVLDQPSEGAARQVFADMVRVAEALDYASVLLRCDGSVVERWPVFTGNDPDFSDVRRAVALISHRATNLHEGIHWSLTEAAEAGRLLQLLWAVDFAYRKVIDYFQADAEAIDEQIQRFATTGAEDDADSFDTYNRYAAQAIVALRAEDLAAVNEVIHVVNRDRAGARFVGAVCDVYAGLLPQLSTPEWQKEFLSTWIARITAIEDELN